MLLLTALWLSPGAYAQGTLVLIIDDMGNGLELGQRALKLPGEINFAFLPHTPNSKKLAELAHHLGKEVMLHLPMSNLSSATVGPGKMTPAMDQQQFNDALADNLHAIPYAKGVNNHMGSLLTQLHQPMGWLMDDLKQRRLYFIDSRTSPLSVAERTAKQKRLPTLHRDVFIDNVLDPEHIERQVERWQALAESQGIAVAIAHPHPETLQVLERMLPLLQQQGKRLTFASDVLADQIAQLEANAASTPNL